MRRVRRGFMYRLPPSDGVMHEAQFLHDRTGEDERIQVRQADAAVEGVQRFVHHTIGRRERLSETAPDTAPTLQHA